MALQYNFTLSNGSALATLYALEGNGTGNFSVPRQILEINFGASPFITVADDVTARFINGFSFDITGSSAYNGTYTVLGTATTETLANGQLVTHIPLSAAPVNAGFSIVDVITGASGKWIINGPINGSTQFYPTSTFTVSGNGAGNGSYTVASSSTGNQFNIQSITVGAPGIGKFVFVGDITKYFKPATTFKAVNIVHDGTFTISAATLVGSNTEVTVAETIATGSAASVSSLIKLNSPNTIITVTGTIPGGSGTTGTATPAGSSNYNFVNLSPVVITPTTPNHFDVKFRITGDFSSIFVGGSAFLPHNISYNGLPYTNPLNVSSSNFNVVGNYTEVVVDIVDSVTPAITINDTYGYQVVNFTSLTATTNPTNLVPATTYTASISIDGTAHPISILGSDAQTFATLKTQIDTQLLGNGTVSFNVTTGKLIVSSTTTGSLSTVAITDTNLFNSLANYTSISVGVAGTNVSWVTFPVPAIPFGNIQYTVPTISSSLELVGPGSASYNNSTTWGKALQDNVIHLTENFAKTTAPASPLEGQIWFDPSVPTFKAYQGAAWTPLVSVVWPVQNYVDMNNNKIARLADAATTFPYVPSTTGVGNNDQEAINLRSSDLLYISKTGGSSAVAADRSGTMTGSLNMNGASPIGATAIGIAVNSAPIEMYSTSALDFKTGGTGGINFEATASGSVTFAATSTGGVNIQGTGNVTVAQGNVTVGAGTDLVAIQNNPGLAPTVTFTTATTGNSVINMANNKIVNLFTPSSALDAANKAYVDSLANGIIWLQPVKDPNLFDDSLTAPPALDNNLVYHKTYIVATGGSGAWAGLDGRAVVYDPQQSAWVDILGRAVQAGDRFGVFCEPDDNDPLVNLPGGGLTGKAGKIVTIASVGPIVYTDYTPTEPDAFSVTGANPTINNLTNQYDRSPHFGHSYTFRGTWGTGTFGTNYKWIEFAGPQMLVDGAGLLYTGNILNVGAGFGITANADTIQVNATDLDTVYVRRDGTVAMTGNLDLNSNRIVNLANPTGPTDGLNLQYADGRYVALAGSTMNASANITFNGGQVLGLPAVPTVGGAATSKTYVDNQDALRLALAGGAMNLNANITFSGTGEVLGLPATPTTAGSAASKAYVDFKTSTLATDTLVVHLAGIETITGAKTFTNVTTFSNTVDINAALNVGTGANITLSGGAGELLGLPASPSVGGAATSKTYVDAQIATRAADAAVVHLAGIETITGAKTFSAATVMNNSLTLAANGVFTNVTANTTSFSVLGTPTAGGGAYTISLTAGQNTAGVGGSSSLVAGQGSTTGGAVFITGGSGTSTTGGNVTIASGAGPAATTSGNISLTAGNAALELQPTGVWLINSVAPSGVNQAIVSNTTTPATLAPSWQPIAHRVAVAPGSSATAGNPGDFFADDSFFYVYGATGWRRVAVSSF